MNRLYLLPLLLAFYLPATAAVSNDELNLLKNELMNLIHRVELLEAENKKLQESAQATNATAATVAKAEQASSTPVARTNEWTDSISLKGDFRYRYENIHSESHDSRERNRVRARFALTAHPADNLEVGIGVASGGVDPVSTNQTLGAGDSTKDLGLDLAYFKWNAKPDFKVIGGKMKNVWRRAGGNGLVWDGDLRPEGLAFLYSRGDFFLDTGFNFLESDSSKNNASISYGVQTGIDRTINASHLLVGAGYFEMGTANREVFFGDPDDFFGNSFSCTNAADLEGCNYNNDYEELELFAQWTTNLGERPLILFADYVRNLDVDNLDTAWAAGLKYGKARNPRTWEISYTYQNLEADAVFGLLTDSDFAGGGTDSRGHIVTGDWAINKQWKIGVTYFDTERNIAKGTEEAYRRIMLDTAFKF